MTKLNEIYKCGVCGNITEVVHASAGELVCCGEPMVLQTANTVDAAQEKHVPVVEKVEGGLKVSVGSVLHPMEEKHYIEWIEVITENGSYRKHLKPGDTPSVVFECMSDGNLVVREYCNLHGLWKA